MAWDAACATTTVARDTTALIGDANLMLPDTAMDD